MIPIRTIPNITNKSLIFCQKTNKETPQTKQINIQISHILLRNWQRNTPNQTNPHSKKNSKNVSYGENGNSINWLSCNYNDPNKKDNPKYHQQISHFCQKTNKETLQTKQINIQKKKKLKRFLWRKWQ